MCDNLLYFEPTSFFMGILDLHCNVGPLQEDDRTLNAVSHLALLGVKIAGPACWAMFNCLRES